MYLDFSILDVTLLGYYILISKTSFELWFNYSQLFAILYTLIYVGVVIFILSVLNKKEEYQYQYSSLFIIILLLFLDDLDYNDSNDINLNSINIYLIILIYLILLIIILI